VDPRTLVLFTAELAVALEEKPGADNLSWRNTWSSSSSGSDDSGSSNEIMSRRSASYSSSSPPPLGKAALQRVALNALQVFGPVAETLGVRGPLRLLEASAYRVSAILSLRFKRTSHWQEETINRNRIHILFFNCSF